MHKKSLKSQVKCQKPLVKGLRAQNAGHNRAMLTGRSLVVAAAGDFDFPAGIGFNNYSISK
jgi:hypothetical protein